MSITVNGDVIINFTNETGETGNTVNIPVKSVQKLRTSPEMKQTKKRIKARDIHCQCCGEMDKQIQVHHIMPLSDYPELNCDEGNLIGLCQSCHDRYHREYRDDGINAFTFAKFILRYGKRRF